MCYPTWRSIVSTLHTALAAASFPPPDPLEPRVPAVKISPKYQVVIPPAIRRAFKLKPGQRIEVVVHEGRITLVPVGPLRRLRGMTPGIDTRVPRDDDRA